MLRLLLLLRHAGVLLPGIVIVLVDMSKVMRTNSSSNRLLSGVKRPKEGGPSAFAKDGVECLYLYALNKGCDL